MSQRTSKLDRIADELAGIRVLLEAIFDITNPIAKLEDFPNEDETVRAFYTSEDDEIVAHHLRLMGKEPKPRTPK